MSKLRILFAGFFFALLVLSVTWGWRGIPEYGKIDIDYGFPLIWEIDRQRKIEERESANTRHG